MGARAEGGGLLEGSARVLREVLRTPRVRATLQLLRDELDPEAAPLVVRALMEDQAAFLDGLATAPRAVNALLGGARELVARISTLPPALLRSVTRRLVAELDAEAAGAVAGGLLALAHVHAEADEPAARGAAERFAVGLGAGLDAAGLDAATVAEATARRAVGAAATWAAVLGRRAGEQGSVAARAVAAAAAEIRRAGREHPELFARVARPLAEALRDAVEGAARVEEAADAG